MVSTKALQYIAISVGEDNLKSNLQPSKVSISLPNSSHVYFLSPIIIKGLEL
jgi:hypothetical protein